MAENKLRKKLKKNRISLDIKHWGNEPFYEKTLELSEIERANAWSKGAGWYNYFYKSKDYIPAVMAYAAHIGYTKKQITHLKKLKDWKFIKVAKSAQLWARGYEYTESEIAWHKEIFDQLLKDAKLIIAEKVAEEKDKPKPPTPAERAYNRMMDTIYMDWDIQVVDQWMDGNYKIKFPLYELWKTHGLKGNVINKFREFIQFEYDVISDAYNKTCEQAVENYSHVKKSDLKQMMKTMESIFADLDRLKDGFKATKLPRAKKPKASDVQVRNLKYKEEDVEAKLVSINPILIPGRRKLFVYNTKQRKLTEFVTTATKGFEVSGTTLKNFDTELSRTATLRKPDDILPMILNKTELQINKIWDDITTKISKPNGRINADCILLRTFE